jgi:hypothetical protein
LSGDDENPISNSQLEPTRTRRDVVHPRQNVDSSGT